MTDRVARLRAELKALGDPNRAAGQSRFFKTGPGQYGEGDRFRGLTVPVVRRLARSRRDLTRPELAELLASEWHEDRLLALIVLTAQCGPRATEATRRTAFEFYIAHIDRVNNWDLVDVSAPAVVGEWIADHPREGRRLDAWARSADLWERRVAIVATFATIRRGAMAPTLRIAARLLGDRHDLIHKAVGWMLRGAWKRDAAAVEPFLIEHQRAMPRTMLRYAIERMDPARRRAFMKGEAA